MSNPNEKKTTENQPLLSPTTPAQPPQVLYPNLQLSYQNIPPPAYPVTNTSGAVFAPKQVGSINGPLLPQYPVSSPQPCHGPKCKSNKALCYCFLLICGFCCAIVLLATIAGIIAAVFFAQCSNLQSSKTEVFSVDASFFSNYDLTTKTLQSSIKIIPASGYTPNATITVLKRSTKDKYLNDFDISFDHDQSSLTFKLSTNNNGLFDWIRACKKTEITLELPSIISNNPSLTIQSTNGDIDANDLSMYSFSSLNLLASNGGISASKISTYDGTFQNSNGDIHLNQIQTTHAMKVKTSNGDIKATGTITVGYNSYSSDSSLEVSTSNGDITFDSLSVSSGSFPTASISMETSNGDISAQITGFLGSFVATSNGDVDVVGGDLLYFSVNERGDKEGNYGYGSTTLNAHTTNSDIELSLN